MKKKFFIVAAAIISNHAIAQTDSTKMLDEVTVTANKFEQKQNTTGKVITIITKEQIEKAAGLSLSQLLNQQGSVVINGALNNTGSVQTVFMRGATSGRTLILIDGMPVNDASEINNNFDLNFISLNDVERIEICKGASSTMYGSDAIAGVINIITVKKDISKPFNIKATAQGGSFGTFKSNAQLYGKEGILTYSAGYSKISSNGFSSAYDSTGKNNFDKDGYNGDVVTARFSAKATNNLTLNSFFNYSKYKTDADLGLFTDEKDYTIHNKNLFAGAGFTFHKNIFSLTGNYRYNNGNRNYLNDSNSIASYVYFEDNKYYNQGQYAELYANIKAGKNFSFLAGSDYRYGKMNQQYFSITDFGPYTDNFKDTGANQLSFYASAFYNSSNKKLNAELGGRWNKHSQYGSNFTYTFNPSYNISDHYRVFASVATGFKAPTLYQLYVAYSGNINLKPEKSINYEAGFSEQHEITNSRLVFFYRDIKDGIDYDYINYVYYNFNSQVVRGLEYELEVNPAKGFTASFNYTYLWANEYQQSRTDFKDTGYNYLLRRPKHLLNMNFAYAYKGFSVSVNAKYVSSRYDVGGFASPDAVLPSYFILGAYSEYKFNNHIKIFATLQNFTNKKFFDVRGYNATPFSLLGGVSLGL